MKRQARMILFFPKAWVTRKQDEGGCLGTFVALHDERMPKSPLVGMGRG